MGNSKFKSSELVKELSLQGTFFSSVKNPRQINSQMNGEKIGA